ncbi:MAG: hypothetical protein J6X55_01220 [Victivallales bacterium]|nr:hypothetical protein [Victivallales bacterium]
MRASEVPLTAPTTSTTAHGKPSLVVCGVPDRPDFTIVVEAKREFLGHIFTSVASTSVKLMCSFSSTDIQD